MDVKIPIFLVVYILYHYNSYKEANYFASLALHIFTAMFKSSRGYSLYISAVTKEKRDDLYAGKSNRKQFAGRSSLACCSGALRENNTQAFAANDQCNQWINLLLNYNLDQIKSNEYKCGLIFL